ncbi:MAG: DUF342 domain-containing protein [Bdellovibrionales bacterium]|nr:DUF342 domain-containing protein [Bdellovibrionales bacterium]
MSKAAINFSNELFSLTGTTADEDTKLFIEIEVLSRSQELTAKMIEVVLLQTVAEDLLDRGVLEDVAKVLRDHNKIEKRRVAKGTLPQKGIDGKLLFLKRKLSREPHLDESDEARSVSMKELGLFENIRAGEPVARVYHPKEGIPGRSVFGREIAASTGDAVELSINEETLSRESGEGEGLPYDRIVAKVDGYLEVQGPKLTICEEFVVRGNLDAEYGNLNFVGSVKVTGDVFAGFSIFAEKGISIGGNVNKALLNSMGGPIEIKGRFFGEGSGKIVTTKHVRVRSIQDGIIDCGEDIFIGEEARGSVLRARGTIQGKRAQILGGKTYTAVGTQLAQLGSEDEIETFCILGSDIEVSEEYQILVVRITEHEKAVELLNAHLGPFAKNTARLQNLKANLRAKMDVLLKKREKVQSSLDSLLEKQQSLLANAFEAPVIPLSVEKNLFPGVVVSAGEATFQTHEVLSGPLTVQFVRESSELALVEYVEVKPVSEEEGKKA